MAKNIKVDPKKVKKEELQGIFSKVLDKLKKGQPFQWRNCGLSVKNAAQSSGFILKKFLPYTQRNLLIIKFAQAVNKKLLKINEGIFFISAKRDWILL